MSHVIAWPAAQAENPEIEVGARFPIRSLRGVYGRTSPLREGMKCPQPSQGRRKVEHQQHPHFPQRTREMAHPEPMPRRMRFTEEFTNRSVRRNSTHEFTGERRWRCCGGNMWYSIETGRLPSLLGRAFFRAKVTSYTMVTFEDRVIFVHDIEKCLSAG